MQPYGSEGSDGVASPDDRDEAAESELLSANGNVAHFPVARKHGRRRKRRRKTQRQIINIYAERSHLAAERRPFAHIGRLFVD